MINDNWEAPDGAALLKRSRRKLAEYIDELEQCVKKMREQGEPGYDFAIETVQTAVRLAAEQANVDSLKQHFGDELNAAA